VDNVGRIEPAIECKSFRFQGNAIIDLASQKQNMSRIELRASNNEGILFHAVLLATGSDNWTHSWRPGIGLQVLNPVPPSDNSEGIGTSLRNLKIDRGLLWAGPKVFLIMRLFERFHAFDQNRKNVALLLSQGNRLLLDFGPDFPILREVSLAALVMGVLHEMRGDFAFFFQTDA
jgi:hypothetical protein